MKIRHWKCALLVAVICATTRMPANAEPATIIKAGRLLDGHGGAAVAPAMVRVEGEKIAEVGSNLAVPPEATVIDLGDATLLPGLIDLHTHLTGKMGVHWEDAPSIRSFAIVQAPSTRIRPSDSRITSRAVMSPASRVKESEPAGQCDAAKALGASEGCDLVQ